MTTASQNIKSFLPDFCSARTVFVLIQWVTLVCTGILCAFRKQFYKYNDYWVATISYGITILVTFVFAELTWWLVTMRSIDFNFPRYEHYLFLLRIMGISVISIYNTSIDSKLSLNPRPVTKCCNRESSPIFYSTV